MPDSRLIPNGKYGFVGHTTLESMNIPKGLTLRDMRHLVAKVFNKKMMKVRSQGKTPSEKEMMDRLAKNPKVKRTWFDGCKFEVQQDIDDEVAITTATVLRFPQTEDHPDMKTPIDVPDDVKHEVRTRVNNLNFTDMKVHNRRGFYVLDGDKEYDIKGSLHFRIYGDSLDMAIRNVAGAKGTTQRAHVDLTSVEWDSEPYNGEQVILWN